MSFFNFSQSVAQILNRKTSKASITSGSHSDSHKNRRKTSFASIWKMSHAKVPAENFVNGENVDDGTTNTKVENSAGLYISNVNATKGGSALLIIDPQNDFVDEKGSLCVPGAIEDCERISRFIHENLEEISAIYVTLDSHQRYHIAHPSFWTPEPEIFHDISHQDILDGKYTPVDETMKEWVKHYTKELEKGGRFKLTIWPPHCLLGSWGHSVYPQIEEALSEWEKFRPRNRASGNKPRCVEFIFKGNNSKTEHYSALRAEVAVDEDATTDFNETLYERLKAHNNLYIAGQARSHCVNFTVRDLVQRLEADANISLGKKSKNEVDSNQVKLVLLEGGMSDVANCEKMGNDFWKDMISKKGIESQDIQRCRVEADQTTSASNTHAHTMSV